MKRTSHAVAAGTLLSATLFLAGCGGSDATSSASSATPAAGSTSTASNTPAATGTTVAINNFVFSPDPITVAVGSTDTWTNDQDVAHTVTADDGSFDSGNLATGDTFEHTFDAAGTFTYHCSIHPNMTGTVIVQ